jgi:DNA modification methylase
VCHETDLVNENGVTLGDSLEVLKGLPDESIDAVCTDPPYGIRFMGEAWDGREIEEQARANRRDVSSHQRLTGSPDSPNRKLTQRTGSAFQNPAGEAGSYDFSPSGNRAFQAWCEAWGRECLRVLKPGGFLLSFGGTRTAHRLACGLEDAGFEIRDTVLWLYGKGFPKSHNVSMAIDKRLGGGGEWQREDHPGRPGARTRDGSIIGQTNHATEANPEGLRHVYEPGSEEARRWRGWGTALKPGHEPIVVARKPLRGTVAANVLEHGTGALNIGATRLGEDAGWSYPQGRGGRGWGGRESLATNLDEPMEASDGRWPANVVLSHHEDCVLVGEKTVVGDGHFNSTSKPSAFGASGFDKPERERDFRREVVDDWDCHEDCPVRELDAQTARVEAVDAAGASRFFYCAKASRAEREAGLEGFELGALNWSSGEQSPGTFQSEGTDRRVRNDHPTVKPIGIMRWLLRLVVPPGGVVLDPFLGSGTTAIAAGLEGFRWLGVEREAKYARIAEARIAFWREHGEDGVRIASLQDAARRRRREAAEAGQLDLFAGV